MVEQADKGGNAQRYAAADLQRAHDELSDADRLDGQRKYDEARYFAQRAEVDADVAVARGNSGEAQKAAADVTRATTPCNRKPSGMTPAVLFITNFRQSHISMESVVKNIITVTALAAVLAACASAPQRNDQLEQARVEVQTLSADPLAQQAASGDMDAARASLNQADTAFQQKEPPEKVNQLAYLAMRHAQAGEARISEARARQEVARSQQDRDRILLQARERETQNAQTQAAVAQNQAAAAQGELADAQKELADLKAKQTDRGMVMTLGDVLFEQVVPL